MFSWLGIYCTWHSISYCMLWIACVPRMQSKKNYRNCSLEPPIFERWKQVTGSLFHMRITVNVKDQIFNGTRLILFNEIGVKLVNFWISLYDPNAFTTRSMLIQVLEDTDSFLSHWTTKGYFVHNTTVFKYSQMLFLSGNVWNQPKCGHRAAILLPFGTILPVVNRAKFYELM